VNGKVVLIHSAAPRRIRLLLWKVTSTKVTCTPNIFIKWQFQM